MKISSDFASTYNWRPSFITALKVFIPWRILLSLWAAVIVTLFPLQPMPGTNISRQFIEASRDEGFVADRILEPWLRWDAIWYTHIARHGYHEAQTGATAFAPVYPMLIALLGKVLGERYLLASLLISNTAAFGVLVLLHRFVQLEFSEKLANRVLVCLVVFPASFYFLAPYTESLFLFLTLGSFLAARHQRWALSSILGALATLVRWQGVLLILPLAWEFLEQQRAARPWQDWKTWGLKAWRNWIRALWLALIPLTLLAAIAIFKIADLPLFFELYVSEWNRTFNWPWVGLLRTPLAYVGTIPLPGINRVSLFSDWFLSMIFAALLIAGRHTLSGPLLIYGSIQLLTFIAPIAENAILVSVTRYILVIFPGFIMLALIAQHHRRFEHLVIIGGTALQLLLSGMFLTWLWVA
ncbi:MAG: hypothetical protein Kow0077_21820 [Anaerolineae bacterium]